MEEDKDMRNMLLTELIDKMHGRMADKMFPPDPSLDDVPAAAGITQDGKTAEGFDIPRSLPSDATETVATDDVLPANDMSHGDEPTDEELEEMLKNK
jgi:hypothetical protein